MSAVCWFRATSPARPRGPGRRLRRTVPLYWAGAGAHERQRCLESGQEPAAPLPWLPQRMASLWKVVSGLHESKETILQRLVADLEQPTLHNYQLSIRPVMEDLL